MVLRGAIRAPVPITPQPPTARSLDPLTLAAITSAVNAAVATLAPGDPSDTDRMSPFAAQIIFGG